MKSKIFLLLGICCFALVACEGGDGKDVEKPGNGNNGENDTPQQETLLTWTKRASCPIMSVNERISLNGVIYMASTAGDFVSYDPTKDTWNTLTRISGHLFAWQENLYRQVDSDIYIYRSDTDTWEEATNLPKLTPMPSLSPSIIGLVYSIGGRLFQLHGSSNYYNARIYQSNTHKWEDTEINRDGIPLGVYLKYFVPNTHYCEVKNCLYLYYEGVILQFNPTNCIFTTKISLDHTPSYIVKYDENNILYYSPDKKGYHYRYGFYSITKNEYSTYDMTSAPESPAPKGPITNINNRLFFGPDNAAFYELKIK